MDPPQHQANSCSSQWCPAGSYKHKPPTYLDACWLQQLLAVPLAPNGVLGTKPPASSSEPRPQLIPVLAYSSGLRQLTQPQAGFTAGLMVGFHKLRLCSPPYLLTPAPPGRSFGTRLPEGSQKHSLQSHLSAYWIWWPQMVFLAKVLGELPLSQS